IVVDPVGALRVKSLKGQRQFFATGDHKMRSMDYRKFGSTDLAPGIIGLGTWRTFDVPLDDKAAIDVRRQVVDEAIEAGSNFFDSSPMYGAAEQVLAGTLEGRRDTTLVATKVWAQDFARGRDQIDTALRWFGGFVDVYQIHNLVNWRQYLPLLQDLQSQGNVRSIGITHYQKSAFGEMARIMETEQIQSVQLPYNALDTEAEQNLLPLTAELNLGVIVMSPLGTGDLVRGAPPDRELEPLAAYGIETWAQALLKWVVSDGRVTVTIPATSKPERARENAAAGNPPFFGEEQRERVSWLARRASR
ncbi:MAG: aldo/keto reductase, partial [Chloroflexota bacterium]